MQVFLAAAAVETAAVAAVDVPEIVPAAAEAATATAEIKRKLNFTVFCPDGRGLFAVRFFYSSAPRIFFVFSVLDSSAVEMVMSAICL